MNTRPKTARFVVCLRDVTRDYCPNIRVATCCLKPQLSRFFDAAVKARMDLLRNSACAIFGALPVRRIMEQVSTVAEKGHFVGRPPDPWPPLGRSVAAPWPPLGRSMAASVLSPSLSPTHTSRCAFIGVWSRRGQT